MKRKNPHQNSLFKQKASTTIATPVASPIEITPNVCLEKGDCAICVKNTYYGKPLTYILHYRDGGIATICTQCARKAAKRLDVKMPRSEERREEIQDRVDLKRISRRVEKKNDTRRRNV